MKSIWLIGCSGSSEMVDVTSGTPIVCWPDQGSVSLGSLHACSLNAAGTGPGPAPAVALNVRGHVKGYMNNLEAIIRQDLNPSTGWNVSVKPYDWRESIIRTATLFASQALALPLADLPLSIVAHGQGGLIARLVWRSLNLAGQSARIRRIITLGTAQWGCYPTCSTLQGRDGWQASVLALPNQGWILYNPNGQQPTRTPYDVMTLARLASTWPSNYEQLPFVSTPGSNDPGVPGLYLASTWPSDANVSQAWLDHSKNVFQPMLTDNGSYPPGSVLTCYRAGGMPTTNSLLNLSIPGIKTFPTPGTTGDGDGRSILALQSITGSYNLDVIGEHYSLPDHPGVLRTIVSEIAVDRVSPGPYQGIAVPDPGSQVDQSFPMDPIATIPQAAVPTPQGICPLGKCVC